MYGKIVFLIMLSSCILTLHTSCYAACIGRVKPVVLYPRSGQEVCSGDSLALRYYADEGEKCCILISDENGVVFSKKIKSGALLRNGAKDKYVIGRGGLYLLPADTLVPDKRYFVQVVSGLKVSEPVFFTAVNKSKGSVEADVFVNIINASPLRSKFSRAFVAPDRFLSSAALSGRLMETIEVDVWKLDENNKRYPSKIKLTVNSKLKNNYINVFKELYSIAFPIKSAGCYNYRDTHGGRLSEHAMGTAVDINPDENLCIYSDGSTVGKYYRPYEDPYSVTPEVVKIFKKYGFEWGGKWTGTIDYMHFAYFDS